MADDRQETIAAGLQALPAGIRQRISEAWQSSREQFTRIPAVTESGRSWLKTLPRVWAGSNFAAQTCRRYPAVLQDLVESGDLFRSYARNELAGRLRRIDVEAMDQSTFMVSLREWRRREFLRIAWRDLAGWSELEEVMAVLSDFADVTIDVATAWAYQQVAGKHGFPVGEHSGLRVRLVVLAMGKLGGGELNFSSDVDLIFAYPEAGETDGGKPVSNHEFFLRVARLLINVLNEATADGFVFRVDMRLRPNGESGPLALSFEAMENYYQTRGREWERYALIKARPMAGDIEAGERLLGILRPFVYRKYLDYGAVESIRHMKAQIEQELQRKGMMENIKLGPGGIREIEFIVQALQLTRGGREPDLQRRRLLSVLPLLVERGYLARHAAAELKTAYFFLRNTENRLQMLADQQLHQLPDKDDERSRLALTMGFDDWPAFAKELQRHRDRVQGHFSQAFIAPQRESVATEVGGLAGVWQDTLDRDVAAGYLRAAGYTDPEAAMVVIDSIRQGSDYRDFSEEGRNRMDQLMPQLIAAAGASSRPQHTLTRILQIIQAIGRRSTYLALLAEHPLVISQLTKLCAASSWITDWISQHPILLDELLAPANLYTPLDRQALQTELQGKLERIDTSDPELQMDVAREFKHGHILRVAAADIGPGLPPEAVGRHLSDIAEAVLTQVYDLAYKATAHQYGEPQCQGGDETVTPGFAVIAYGKLGSLELGYTSDLDIIFLFRECDDEGVTSGPREVPIEVFFARLAQRMIHFLTTRTPAGILYDVDTRLRPGGLSGLLVTGIAAFLEYQHRHAWTWEHQALVRARPVAGNGQLCQQFRDCRHQILAIERDAAKLKIEILDMRNKMRDTKTRHEASLFDLKHDRGGIVDIEFMVQYWVLRWAAAYPALTRYTDNSNILKQLAELGLLANERSTFLIEAYRRYLSAEHHAKLLEDGSLVERQSLGDLPDKVSELWSEVFEQASSC